MMAKLLPVSQYCVVVLPPKLGFHGGGGSGSSTDRTFVRFLTTSSRSSELGTFSGSIGAQQQHQKWVSRRTRVVSSSSDSKAPTIIVEEIQPDSIIGGGDGAGHGGEGGGGGGGGGGGDNNSNSNEEEGEEAENDNVDKSFSMSMSQKLTLGYAALVGGILDFSYFCVQVGGVMGYLKSGSKKSLIAGGLSALLLYYVFTLLPTRPALASSLGFGLSAALLGVMGSRFKKSGKIFPAGVVSLVSLIMSGGYIHGVLRSLH
ncbi:protein FATTY ACID EXPORT 2, chloroplastic-like isoform X1 [Camellia sinensis]|uniref:protein FATTY ACID EXPORT 2, chloroplastic-like isoform X1 n=1 Tax=Camellia sinensis TaxID=4442 RepID=UPI0010355FB0|nr:protein FATTY ACID EXPORT 2, chloroplastic-like isoform X1 [Camellia sinensis]